jgi:hypothetical protein
MPREDATRDRHNLAVNDPLIIVGNSLVDARDVSHITHQGSAPAAGGPCAPYITPLADTSRSP